MTDLLNIAPRWAAENPKEAMEWAKNLQNPWLQRYAIELIGRGLSVTEPKRALELADELPSDYPRRNIYEAAAETMTEANPKSAAEWAKTIDSPLLRNSTMRKMLNGWMNSSMAEALQYVIQDANAAAWIPMYVEGLQKRAQAKGKKLAPAMVEQLQQAIRVTFPPSEQKGMLDSVARYGAKITPKQ